MDTTLFGVAAPRASATDFWLPTGDGSVRASWFWPRTPLAPDAVGVVIVPGIAHEEQTMAVGLVALARELADRGVPALLIDLAGTAQGSGDLTTPGLGQQWGHDIRSAVEHARRAGLRRIAVVGVRLGSLLAMEALSADPVDLFVGWAPVTSGRRYRRELELMAAASDDPDTSDLPGATVAGFNYPPDLMRYLSTLDAGRLDGKPAARLCVIDTSERLATLDLSRGSLADIPMEQLVATSTEPWLFSAVDGVAAPFDDLGPVAEYIRSASGAIDRRNDRALPMISAATPAPPDVASMQSRDFDYDGHRITESFVRFGRTGLVGIVSSPTDAGDVRPGPAYVAVTMVGPGRIFVDLARREAALGRTTLRFDLSGFGTSERLPGEAWADFYHEAAQDEIAEAVEYLHADGHPVIDVVGFCAGAWSAVQMRPHPAVRRVVGINLQLFVRGRLLHRRPWPAQVRRQRALARFAQRDVVRRSVKKIELLHPLPSPAVRWIRRLQASGHDVVLVFADDDQGLAYYRSRAERRFGVRSERHRPELRLYNGLGHLPMGTIRDQMLRDLHDLN